ncbi:MAG: rhodanese-like domain-containing protein [Phycisphaeraceae bacterium]|nr:rhodanese-like domain-containing protein [Phycisphaeraceae bacterium]
MHHEANTMFQRTILWAMLLLPAVALPGCPSQRKTSDKDLSIINRTLLNAMMQDEKTKDKLLVIDVRKPAPYAEGHIPGAINIPMIELKKDDPRLAEAKNIVVYGDGKPDDLLSAAAGKKLVAFGYVNVFDFRGGMEEWTGRRRFEQPLMDRRMEEKAGQ